MLIYDKHVHGLYNDWEDKTDYFSLVVYGCLEIFFDYNLKKLMYVGGYFPINTAKKKRIKLPEFELRDYHIDLNNLDRIEKTVAYDLDMFQPASALSFCSKNLYYDAFSGIIKLGKDNKRFKHYKISENLYVAVDLNNNLQCIYIKPDKFV